MVEAVKAQGGRFQPGGRPLLDGALDVTYTSDVDGTHFVGEIATVRRGDMLYNIHFNSTRGTAEVAKRKIPGVTVHPDACASANRDGVVTVTTP